MPRAIWSGAISFGLVNVPVKLFSAVSPKDVRFNQLEEGTNARIKQKRVSADTGMEVPYEKIIKGYEVAPGQYVPITPEVMFPLPSGSGVPGVESSRRKVYRLKKRWRSPK